MVFHGGIHGHFPEAISPWENRSHTKSCFTVGKSHLPVASVNALVTILLLYYMWQELEVSGVSGQDCVFLEGIWQQWTKTDI